MWIRLDDLSANQTLFSKDTNTFPDGMAIQTFINNTDGFLAVEIGEIGNLTNRNPVTSDGNCKVTAEQWTFTGFSIALETTTGNTANIRMWINDASDQTSYSGESNWYIDDATAHKAYLGAYRSDSSVFEQMMTGFIYKVNIYNNAESTPGSS